MNLNESQMRAIEHIDGPMLVLAGPGSGKTTVITKRTLELIESQGIMPENILVITFTKAAALEMKERFEKLSGRSGLPVNFGTCHAVFFKIIRYAYSYTAANILTDDQRYSFLRESIAKLGLEIDDEKDFIENISSEISLVKSENINLSNYYSTSCSEKDFRRMYEEYDRRLKGANLIDFDDMMLICLELLEQRPDILAFWQDRYRYILVDEFQDINMLQYRIIRLLAAPQNNLFIVGDDDQSIYRFRGARPEIMLGFNRDYPDAKRVLLDVNYRCPQPVMNRAMALIGCNKNRFEKDIKALKEEGAKVFSHGFAELKDQNDFVINELLDMKKKGRSLNDAAILYRTNSQPRALIEKLSEFNIPFRTRDRLPNIYEHWITKNILAYMEMARGNMDRSLFISVCNRPKRYISRESIRDQAVDLDKLREAYKDRNYVVEKINRLEYDLRMLSKLNPYAGINYIRKAMGYDEYLKEYADYRRMNEEELLDTIGELQEAAGGFATLTDWQAYIEDYSKELKEQERKQRERGSREGEESVQLMTFHSAKGLEFPFVFIVDANEGITPHKKAIVPEDIEEERRMFYVAMTRASEKLWVLYAENRYGKKLEPSRFVGEMLVNRSKLVEGTRVEHVVYGVGEVKSQKAGRITIKFEEVALPKVLDLETCIQRQLLKIL